MRTTASLTTTWFTQALAYAGFGAAWPSSRPSRPRLHAAVLVGAGLADRRARAKGGGEFRRGYLDCVAEAAQRGARELARLHAAAEKITALPESAPSPLQAAGAVALRAVMRRIVGHRRFEGLEAFAGLAQLYATSRLFVNPYRLLRSNNR